MTASAPEQSSRELLGGCPRRLPRPRLCARVIGPIRGDTTVNCILTFAIVLTLAGAFAVAPGR